MSEGGGGAVFSEAVHRDNMGPDHPSGGIRITSGFTSVTERVVKKEGRKGGRKGWREFSPSFLPSFLPSRVGTIMVGCVKCAS